jgi:predicted nucleic acid-binding Zn ribbon protein
MARAGVPAKPPRPRRTLRQRRKKEAAPAAEAIAEALAFSGLTGAVRAHRIITEWREMVGDRVAARTWPDGLKDRVLWIRVSSSAWLHELTLVRAQILDGIHRVLGEPRLVDELKLHIGARKQIDSDDQLAMVARARGRRPRPPPRPLGPPASGEAKAKIERETDDIADPELRELIRNVRVKHDR